MPGFLLVTKVGVATRDPRVLAELAQLFLRCVVASNRVYLRECRAAGKPVPALYQAGVEYDREPWAGRYEEFADISTVLRRGWGDCDDLAAWLCAELQEQGEPADIHIYWRDRRCDKCGISFKSKKNAIHCPKCGQVAPRTMHIEVRRGSKCGKCGVLQQTGQPPKDITQHPLANCTACGALAVPWGRIVDPSRFLGLL